MDRQLNYIFIIALVFIFVLWAPAGGHRMIILGALASFLFCGLAFFLKWLSLDGAAAAMVVGTIAFGVGGWPIVLALLIFFLTSAVISFGTSSTNNPTIRRDGLQVWANGFWIVTWLILGMITDFFICWLAASGAVATATADTWATELGSRRFKVSTYSALGFEEVPAGTEGGVSWPGLGASLAGSIVIGCIIFAGFSLPVGWIILITFAGFAGSLSDSYLGASIQGATRLIKIPLPGFSQEITISNNAVNWIATGVGSILILILNLIFYELV